VRAVSRDPNPAEPRLYWAQLLHFYQPPTQTHDVLRRVAEESYRPLLAVLREHPQARLAVNINAVLTELLVEHGLGDVVQGLAELAERGQVEFVGSGRFHPILPLITEGERTRSIAENSQVNRRLLGKCWNPAGFFPPEMCYSAEILPAIASAGHEWLVVSGVAYPNGWPVDVVSRVPVPGKTLSVLFRDDARSNRISFRETAPHQFLDDLERAGGGEQRYIVTAMDAETYGHHIRGWEQDFLAATYTLLEERASEAPDHGTSRVEMVMPGELPGLFPPGPIIEPLASSWSTTRDDIAARNPYPLWHAPGNRVHDLQWEYIHLATEILAVAQRYADTPDSRRFAALAAERLQPALHSCQFWWASRRPMWDVTLIHRGFLMLNEVALYAMRAVWKGSASERVKREIAWRMAAANEARAQLERELFGEMAP
jgi:alpha-amylase/alpha-mannosidase (GH57 family)